MNNRYSNILGVSEAAKKIEQDNKKFFSSKDQKNTNLNIVNSNKYKGYEVIKSSNSLKNLDLIPNSLNIRKPMNDARLSNSKVKNESRSETKLNQEIECHNNILFFDLDKEEEEDDQEFLNILDRQSCNIVRSASSSKQ